MWCACAGTCFVVVQVMMFGLHFDFFRAAFFTSPAWITCIVGPFQKERDMLKLSMFMVFMFLGFWSVVHCFPCQCRHAWGTMMVADQSYWTNDTAIEEAVLQEIDSYYLMKDLDHASWSVPPTSNHRPALQGLSRTHPRSVSTLLQMLGDDPTQFASASSHDRVKKWIAPLTGGLSLDNLKLRAYCHIHRYDKRMPHVYPLKVVGIAAQQLNITLPCPHWTCLLTEARPGGKLVYFEILALVALLTYVHYRCDCLAVSVWLFGTGQCRIWWLWFWATLLPLWSVMLLKTTYDQELSETLSGSLTWTFTGARDWFEEDLGHQVTFFIGLIGAAALYVYRERVRKELGLDEHSLVYLFPRRQVTTESHFQVCVWRVDVNAETAIRKFDDFQGLSSEASSSTQRTHYGQFHESLEERSPHPGFDAGNCYVCKQDPMSIFQRVARSYFPLTPRSADGNFLRTRDDKLPALCVRFYYGNDEVQSTRTVRPSTTEWSSEEGSIFFQENFKISVERRPDSKFRVEIRDTGASLGHVTLGHITFTEHRLRRQFERSRRAEEDRLGEREPIALQQVILSMRSGASPVEEEALLRRMVDVGFAPHRLSEGGAVWLAFSEASDEQYGPCMCRAVPGCGGL